LRHTGVSKCVTGIFFDGLVEIRESLLKVGDAALVPVVPALEIKLISLWILRALSCDLLLRSAAQPGPQFFRDVAGNLLLQRDDIGGIALVALAPELDVIANAGQLRTDLDILPSLCDPAGE